LGWFPEQISFQQEVALSTADKLMTLSITVEFAGFERDGDTEARICESINECFAVSDSAVELTEMLREIADAVEQGKLYGWMRQNMADSAVNAGDIRPETRAEELERWRAEHEETPTDGAN
jgi:hypothetical protein